MMITDDVTGFQHDLLLCDIPRLAVSGGLGLGKTAVAARFAVYQMVKYAGSRGAVACPTYPQLFQSIYIEIEELLLKYGIRHRWHPQHKKLVLSNGSTVYFKSFDVPEGNLKGAEYHWGLIDEADMTQRAHHDRFADRIGRDKKVKGSGLLRVFGNPVPHSHFMYEDYRQKELPDHKLWEIATHENRRYLADGYIERLEARYEPGTAGHKRWLLGQCGVPSEKAIYSEFDITKDSITDEQIAAEGGIVRHNSGLYFGRPGLPAGYLLSGRTREGTLVALDEVYTTGRPATYTANKIGGVHPGGRILSDRYHSLYNDFRKAGVKMSRARTDRDIGISRFRTIIAEGNFKVRHTSQNVISCPQLRNELESHETNEAHQPQAENCSLIIPMEYVACSMRDKIDPAHLHRLGLGDVFNLGEQSANIGGMMMNY